jgi:hypothetical protein
MGMHGAPAPAVGWIFTGGEMEVFVGSSSRDLRLRALVEVPGHAYELPLTPWPSLREWWRIQSLGLRYAESLRSAAAYEAGWAICSAIRWAVTRCSEIQWLRSASFRASSSTKPTPGRSWLG